MNTRTLALGGLILLAALSRLLPHPPNFAPITAMAVFGGIVYRYRRAAVIAPLLALLLSDLVIEVLHRNGLVRCDGEVKVLASRVYVEDNALIDVSGKAGGGQILIGGNAHGAGG